MILCDTNILIEFYKNNIQVVEELRRIGKERLVSVRSLRRNCISAQSTRQSCERSDSTLPCCIISRWIFRFRPCFSSLWKRIP